MAQSHLWRIVNRPDERCASKELIASVARELGLPDDYFIETRAERVADYLRSHPKRLNRLYREAKRSGTPVLADASREDSPAPTKEMP